MTSKRDTSPTPNRTGATTDDAAITSAQVEAAEAAAQAAENAATEDPDGVGAEPLTSIGADENPDAEDLLDAARRGWRLFIPRWRAAAVGVAVTVLVASLAASGYLIWNHHQTTQRQLREVEFTAGARQDVMNLMSLNFNNGQADLQRVLDSTTGSFHDDFVESEANFLTAMQDSKVVTSTSVSATAVESMTGDSAIVLVTATSRVANSASRQPTPRSWRLIVTVNRESDEIKMSKIEFVP